MTSPTNYHRTTLPFGTFSTDCSTASMQLDTAYLTGIVPEEVIDATFHIFLPNNQGKLIRSTKEAITLALAAKAAGQASSNGVQGVLLVKDGILQLELGSPVNQTILVCNVHRDPANMSGPAKALLMYYQRTFSLNPGRNGNHRKTSSAIETDSSEAKVNDAETEAFPTEVTES